MASSGTLEQDIRGAGIGDKQVRVNVETLLAGLGCNYRACVARLRILADKTEQFKALVNALNGEKKADFAASRKRLGVRERTFHQQTPMGDFVVVTLEGDDPAGAFKKFG